MLRLRHLLRSRARPSVFRSGPRQTYTAPAPPTVRHVRFRRPWLRSFFTKALLYGAAFHIWCSFVLVQFADDEDDADASAGPSMEKTASRQRSTSTNELLEDEVEDGEPLFIPLTWSHLQEGELYSRSDPEWQQFVQISNDRKQLQKMRNELATIVLKSVSGPIVQLLGSPLSLSGYWLVHQFPSRAPPTYLRSGLEITDDGISWVTRPLDPDMGDRLQIFMKPVHVAVAIKDAYLVLLRRQLNRLQNPQGQTTDALDFLKEKRMIPGKERVNPLSSHEQSKPQPSVSDSPPGNLAVNEDPGHHPSSIISSLQRLPLPDLGPGSDFHLASIAFQLRLNEYRARSPRTPRRGTFFVSGPVGIKGPNGFCRYEVRGEYDPAKPGWRTVVMELKDVTPRKQRALGDR